MKKRSLYIMGVFLLFFCFSSVLALSTTMKETYQPGETLISKISGNLPEGVKPTQITILRGHVKVPFDYELQNIDGEYYIWALVPLNTSGIYTLLIQDVVTTVNGQRTTQQYYQNFSINGTTVPYAVKPGTIITSSDFELLVTSYIDENIAIPLDFPTVGEAILRPGTNTLKFSIADVVGTHVIPLQVGTYKVVAYITGNATVIQKRYIRTEPSYIEETLWKGGKEVTYSVTLYNTGTETYRNIAVEYDKDVLRVKPDTFKELKANKSISFNVSIIGTQKDISEIVIVRLSENTSMEIPLDIRFRSNESVSSNVTTNTTSNEYYCVELGGAVCLGETSCDGSIRQTRDGECCIGACIAFKEKSNAWIGYLIAGLLILAGTYVYYRYHRAKEQGDVFKKKVMEAEKKTNLP